MAKRAAPQDFHSNAIEQANKFAKEGMQVCRRLCERLHRQAMKNVKLSSLPKEKKK